MKHTFVRFSAGMLVGIFAFCAAGSFVRNVMKTTDLVDVASTAPTNGQVRKYNSTTGLWEPGDESASGITNGADALLNSLTVTNAQTNLVVTASRVAIFDSAKRLTNSAAVDTTELEYLDNVTSPIQTQLDAKAGFTIATDENVVFSAAEASPTNVVDLSIGVATNILDAAVTFLHATNGASHVEKTHVRWLWAGGSDRTLTIPSGWKTNVNSAVPASITNGTITKMYVTSIGATGDSASQTNVFVSFEFYK